MAFKSKAQRRYMYAEHPEQAAEWQKNTRQDIELPERVKKKPKMSGMQQSKAPKAW